MLRMKRVWSIAMLAVGTGCAASLPPIDTSSLAAGGPKLSMTELPHGQELAPIAVASNDGLGDALRRFRDAVAKAGGDFGKIDQVSTRFNARDTSRSFNARENRPMNCTVSSFVSECKVSEVVIPEVDLYGRAFQVTGAAGGH